VGGGSGGMVMYCKVLTSREPHILSCCRMRIWLFDGHI